MATEKPRFSITVDNELLEQIEDYRFGNRISKRSDAIVQLIKYGLFYVHFRNKKIALGVASHEEVTEGFEEYLKRLNFKVKDKS